MTVHTARLAALVLLVSTSLALAAATDGSIKIAGIAFVDSSVSGEGSRAKLPEGAKVYPTGSSITDTVGCPTNQYGTDGLIVAVIDYQGRPTAGSLTVTRHPAGGGTLENAPYYLDINPGRTLQYLGPIRENGSYELHLVAGFGGGSAAEMKVNGSFTLARKCAGQ